MSYEFYKFVHLVSLIGLIFVATLGFFYRLHVGPFLGREKKKFVRAYMIVLFLFLLSGFALLHKLGYINPLNAPLPFWIKFAVWVFLGFYPSVLASSNLRKAKIFSLALCILILLNTYFGIYWKTYE
ncbi:MAG: hypothetical protein NZT61_00500 [Deltaproteobacteria bacterium]|nr:hypothetical protein [Deltaproteobacteria bacterium]MCX7952038.1 hypothetical protein [Deltaproteobacteria bacterium]